MTSTLHLWLVKKSTFAKKSSTFIERYKGLHGYEELRKYCKHNGEYSKELAAIFQERSLIEIEYARGLSKLGGKLHKIANLSQGTTGSCLADIAKCMECESGLHRELSTDIFEHITKNLRSFVEEHYKSRKRTEAEVESAVDALMNARSEATKYKSKAYHCAKENERIFDQLQDAKIGTRRNSDKDIVKYEKKSVISSDMLHKTDRQYHQASLREEIARTDWESTVYKAAGQLQMMEERRLQLIKDSSHIFIDRLLHIPHRLQQMYENVSECAALIDVRGDVRSEVAQKTASLSLPEQVLTSFYAENFQNTLNVARRKHHLERYIKMTQTEYSKFMASKQGIMNLLHSYETNPEYSDEKGLEDAKAKLFSINSTLLYLEACLYKLSCDMAYISGEPRPRHRLEPYLKFSTDKNGLPKATMVVSLQILREDLPRANSMPCLYARGRADGGYTYKIEPSDLPDADEFMLQSNCNNSPTKSRTLPAQQHNILVSNHRASSSPCNRRSYAPIRPSPVRNTRYQSFDSSNNVAEVESRDLHYYSGDHPRHQSLQADHVVLRDSQPEEQPNWQVSNSHQSYSHDNRGTRTSASMRNGYVHDHPYSPHPPHVHENVQNREGLGDSYDSNQSFPGVESIRLVDEVNAALNRADVTDTAAAFTVTDTTTGQQGHSSLTTNQNELSPSKNSKRSRGNAPLRPPAIQPYERRSADDSNIGFNGQPPPMSAPYDVRDVASDNCVETTRGITSRTISLPVDCPEHFKKYPPHLGDDTVTDDNTNDVAAAVENATNVRHGGSSSTHTDGAGGGVFSGTDISSSGLDDRFIESPDSEIFYNNQFVDQNKAVEPEPIPASRDYILTDSSTDYAKVVKPNYSSSSSEAVSSVSTSSCYLSAQSPEKKKTPRKKKSPAVAPKSPRLAALVKQSKAGDALNDSMYDNEADTPTDAASIKDKDPEGANDLMNEIMIVNPPNDFGNTKAEVIKDDINDDKKTNIPNEANDAGMFGDLDLETPLLSIDDLEHVVKSGNTSLNATIGDDSVDSLYDNNQVDADDSNLVKYETDHCELDHVDTLDHVVNSNAIENKVNESSLSNADESLQHEHNLADVDTTTTGAVATACNDNEGEVLYDLPIAKDELKCVMPNLSNDGEGADYTEIDEGLVQLNDKTVKRAKALYEYKATKSDELSIAAGEVISVISDSSIDWWYGTVNDEEGFFPSNYVTLL